MPRILIAECMQEISSFNPVPSSYKDFRILRGAALIDTQRGTNTGMGGAVEVFESAPGVPLVPAYGARAFSAGQLSRKGFERVARELLEHVRGHAKGSDAMYFSMHGAMGADGELDPEGHLLQECQTQQNRHAPRV